GAAPVPTVIAQRITHEPPRGDQPTASGLPGPRLPARPRVPRLRLDPGVEALLVARGVRAAHVMAREAIHTFELRVFLDVRDRAQERDLVVPVAAFAEHGQRH